MIISELAELIWKSKACQSGEYFSLSDIEQELESKRGKTKLALYLLVQERRIYGDYHSDRKWYIKANKHLIFTQRLANYVPPTTLEKEHISVWLAKERYE
tara:strand:- start:234 stop:533 length:300 start_codon:yes stop_codon:yes gene_type:complete